MARGDGGDCCCGGVGWECGTVRPWLDSRLRGNDGRGRLKAAAFAGTGRATPVEILDRLKPVLRGLLAGGPVVADFGVYF